MIIKSLDGAILLSIDAETLYKADFKNNDLKNANFKNHYLVKSDFTNANLTGADFTGAALIGANFSQANLTSAKFTGANLFKAIFKSTTFLGANLSCVCLNETNLSGAELIGVNLSYADLAGANFTGTNFAGANLTHVNLVGANLYNANLNGVCLCGANISNAQGLPTARDYISKFETDDFGVIVYKAITNTAHAIPDYWNIVPNTFIEEAVNRDATFKCACGISFGTKEWVLDNYPKSVIWKCRIHYLDLADVVVPYNTNGAARCGRLELLEVING